MPSDSSDDSPAPLPGVTKEPLLDPELVAQGWVRRFVTDGRRLKEYVALYESMGYEVRTEPARPEAIGPDCLDCRLIALLQFHTLYTRQRS